MPYHILSSDAQKMYYVKCILVFVKSNYILPLPTPNFIVIFKWSWTNITFPQLH